MRHTAWSLTALTSLALAGCLKVLLGLECVDQCVVGDRQCSGEWTEVCIFDILLTGCFVWFPEQDCSARGARCDRGGCLCPPGQALCAVCTDVGLDGLNCGRCGLACGAGRCSGGTCLCDPVSTVRTCGGSPVCVDTSSDPRHCGDCGVACPLVNEACIGGACACPPSRPTACPEGSSGACVDLRSDPAHCGRCGIACAANGVCVEGACGCRAGTVLCAEQAACADLATDPRHCGACGAECVGSCTEGVCH
jgi:hypothetical protein